MGNPRIDWVQVKKENGAPSFIQIYGTLGRIMYSEDEVPYGGTGFRLRSGDHDILCYNDYYVESGMGKDYVRPLIQGHYTPMMVEGLPRHLSLNLKNYDWVAPRGK